MSDIRIHPFNYIKFYLKSELFDKLELKENPIGWSDDTIRYKRHDNYKGIFFSFTNSLGFKDEAKDYIEKTFDIMGANGKLYIIKEEIEVREDGSSDYVQQYLGKADFYTKKIKDNVLNINFNSNELEDDVKSYEGDDFNVEIKESVDNKPITDIELYNTNILGREIITKGKSVVLLPNEDSGTTHNAYTIPTKIITRGSFRHSSVDVENLPGPSAEVLEGTAVSNMFFVDTVQVNAISQIKVKIKIKFKTFKPTFFGCSYRVSLRRYRWNGATYDLQQEETLYYDNNIETGFSNTIDIDEEFNFNLPYDQGLMIVFKKGGNYNFVKTIVEQHDIQIDSKEYYPPSNNLKFMFAHDLLDRYIEIFSGKKGLLKSKTFGRIEKGYSEDGEHGLVGLINGFQIRDFKRTNERYKGITNSFKKIYDSLHSEFNLGLSFETSNLIQKVRIETLDFFFQNEVVVRLPNIIDEKEIEEEVIDDLYFSGLEFGYGKGGDYENEIGLDEPNTKTSYSTPIRSEHKYKQISDIRSDDYGKELIRRKNAENYPDEDTSQDEHIWFLDLKRKDAETFEEKTWDDSLQEIPQGILSPETFRSWKFTPLRMFLRHGWFIRSGMNEDINIEKYIKNISSTANTNLSTFPIGEDNPLIEDQDVQIKDLDYPRLIPKKIKFTHNVDKKLLKLINGKTKKLWKGSYENIPNYYFKFEWKLNNGEIQRGYLMDLKPSNKGEFEFIKTE